MTSANDLDERLRRGYFRDPDALPASLATAAIRRAGARTQASNASQSLAGIVTIRRSSSAISAASDALRPRGPRSVGSRMRCVVGCIEPTPQSVEHRAPSAGGLRGHGRGRPRRAGGIPADDSVHHSHERRRQRPGWCGIDFARGRGRKSRTADSTDQRADRRHCPRELHCAPLSRTGTAGRRRAREAARGERAGDAGLHRVSWRHFARIIARRLTGAEQIGCGALGGTRMAWSAGHRRA